MRNISNRRRIMLATQIVGGVHFGPYGEFNAFVDYYRRRSAKDKIVVLEFEGEDFELPLVSCSKDDPECEACQ